MLNETITPVNEAEPRLRTEDVVRGLRAASLKRRARQAARGALLGQAIVVLGWLGFVVSLSAYRDHSERRVEIARTTSRRDRLEAAHAGLEARLLEARLLTKERYRSCPHAGIELEKARIRAEAAEYRQKMARREPSSRQPHPESVHGRTGRVSLKVN